MLYIIFLIYILYFFAPNAREIRNYHDNKTNNENSIY